METQQDFDVIVDDDSTLSSFYFQWKRNITSSKFKCLYVNYTLPIIIYLLMHLMVCIHLQLASSKKKINSKQEPQFEENERKAIKRMKRVQDPFSVN